MTDKIKGIEEYGKYNLFRINSSLTLQLDVVCINIYIYIYTYIYI